MATLHCQNCEARIDSDARHTQCRHCGALFPFRCAVCARKLRGPFSVFDDERYLTLDEADLQPLCPTHFLRKCPDCEIWFGADENQGFFRCPCCSEKTSQQIAAPEWDDGGHFESEPAEKRETHAAPLILRPHLDFNTVVLASAGCAFVALVSWFLLAG